MSAVEETNRCASASWMENDPPCGRCSWCRRNLLTERQAKRLSPRKWRIYQVPNGTDLCYGKLLR